MKYIKPGNPQPIPCSFCGMAGYQESVKIAIDYITIYDSKGQVMQGHYSDAMRVISEHKTSFCANCGAKLNFKIKRQSC